MRKLKIRKLILANILILFSMFMIIFITPNEWNVNLTILFVYTMLVLVFNGYIID